MVATASTMNSRWAPRRPEFSLPDAAGKTVFVCGFRRRPGSWWSSCATIART